MGFLSRFFKSETSIESPLKWDMHSHILFGIDDGSKSLDYSLLMAERFIRNGYSKIIATPHIMGDYYPNNRVIIEEKLNHLNLALKEHDLPLEVHAAAEYYMDEFFLEKVRSKEDLLTFHDNHILVETSFMNRPVFFKQLFFEIRTLGLNPILAHPERYIYFQENYEDIEEIVQSGVKMQINLLSLSGYYSPGAKKLAQWLIKQGYYDFLGTDAHSNDHLDLIQEVYKSKIFNSIDFDKVENTRL
ncbi:MAG: capsular biosynthesis protein [Bacteroidia bacterium]|nr:capsular biosynthesis protein [Bacteroidia bacterium]